MSLFDNWIERAFGVHCAHCDELHQKADEQAAQIDQMAKTHAEVSVSAYEAWAKLGATELDVRRLRAQRDAALEQIAEIEEHDLHQQLQRERGRTARLQQQLADLRRENADLTTDVAGVRRIH
jgi:chromosome segregation ATPase